MIVSKVGKYLPTTKQPQRKELFNSIRLVLLQAYSNPIRYWHNLEHITSMMEWLEKRLDLSLTGPFEEMLPEEQELFLAVWFHDIVYTPSATDSEKRSVECMLGFFTNLTTRKVLERAEKLILNNIEQSNHDLWANMFLSADYRIFTASPTEYQYYAWAIEREYRVCMTKSFHKRRFQDKRTLFLKNTCMQAEHNAGPFKCFTFEECRNARKNIQWELNQKTVGGLKNS